MCHQAWPAVRLPVLPLIMRSTSDDMHECTMVQAGENTSVARGGLHTWSSQNAGQREPPQRRANQRPGYAHKSHNERRVPVA